VLLDWRVSRLEPDAPGSRHRGPHHQGLPDRLISGTAATWCTLTDMLSLLEFEWNEWKEMGLRKGEVRGVGLGGSADKGVDRVVR
jgi:hypothetical protein